jgi:hypothetical protein
MAANLTLPNPPLTLEGAILPGWMPREFAIHYLQNECYFDSPLTAEQAEGIWQRYKAAVDNLPERPALAPQRLPLTAAENREAATYVNTLRARGATNVLEAIKVNVMECVAHQLIVVTERSQQYARQMRAPNGKIRHCLGLHAAPAAQQLQIAAAPNAVNVKIPHGEFVFTFLNPGGFAIQEMAKHITTTAFDQRLLLWAGYHRSFALMTNEYPEGMDRSLIALLTTDADFVLSPQSPNQGVRDMVRGLRPPLFADFFDERFCMRVRLRKKRCELQIRSQVVWFDAES